MERGRAGKYTVRLIRKWEQVCREGQVMGKGSGDGEGWGYSGAGGAGGTWTRLAQAESREVNVADCVSDNGPSC